MISFLRKHRKVIFITTISGFLAGIFVGLGSYLGSNTRFSDSIAVVADNPISYQKYRTNVNRAMDNLRDKDIDVTEALEGHVKNEVLREMIVEEILALSSGEYGMKVTDFEVAAEVQSSPQFQKDGVFNQEMYYRALWYQLRMKPEEYEDERRKSRMALKFRNLIFSAAKVTPEELKKAYLKRKSNDKDDELKSFEEEKDKISQEIMREKAVSLVNAYLKQYSSRTEIKNFLKEREQGV